MLSNCAIFPKKTAGNFRHGYRCIELACQMVWIYGIVIRQDLSYKGSPTVTQICIMCLDQDWLSWSTIGQCWATHNHFNENITSIIVIPTYTAMPSLHYDTGNIFEGYLYPFPTNSVPFLPLFVLCCCGVVIDLLAALTCSKRVSKHNYQWLRRVCFIFKAALSRCILCVVYKWKKTFLIRLH